jgi:ElaB/YqjD/DUF883 family membrane-anchored ribosome-binding protein
MNDLNAPSTLGTQVPSSLLELRAAEQRRRLHNAVADLRDTVADRMNVKKLARSYVWQATGVAALVGLILGYGMGGMFTR